MSVHLDIFSVSIAEFEKAIIGVKFNIFSKFKLEFKIVFFVVLFGSVLKKMFQR